MATRPGLGNEAVRLEHRDEVVEQLLGRSERTFRFTQRTPPFGSLPDRLLAGQASGPSLMAKISLTRGSYVITHRLYCRKKKKRPLGRFLLSVGAAERFEDISKIIVDEPKLCK